MISQFIRAVQRQVKRVYRGKCFHRTLTTIHYLKAYGFRDKEKTLPLTPDSVMSGASFTKVAFAYMVMALVDEGVLNLDKPVYQCRDHLTIQENDEPIQELLPEGERDFFSTTSDDAFTFELDSQGKTMKMVLHVDGKDLSAKRID